MPTPAGKFRRCRDRLALAGCRPPSSGSA